jgi:hypothetical protein
MGSLVLDPGAMRYGPTASFDGWPARAVSTTAPAGGASQCKLSRATHLIRANNSLRTETEQLRISKKSFKKAPPGNMPRRFDPVGAAPQWPHRRTVPPTRLSPQAKHQPKQ